jgi:hypothetical protein
VDSSTLTRTISEGVEQLAGRAAMDFADAFDVPVNEAGDEELREDFEGSLRRRFEDAIAATHEEFAGCARRAAAWRAG